ncbi:MAG: tRNA (adenosine(37)-N6)-threonylcarbamoyltransferase complex ATPase subunit type 1 TsaE [Rhizomicrobium sp.]
MYAIEVICENVARTAALAHAFGPFVRPGDAILLSGALASGKTYFVQNLVKTLGSSDRVTSPTYAIANSYQTEAGPFLHVDAYRLSGVAEFRDLGFDDLDGAIVAIEWGEKLQSEFPNGLHMNFAFCGTEQEQRRIRLSGSDARWAAPLANLRDEFERMSP